MACNFSQSISKDLITGLSTRGDGLSAEEVYISYEKEKVIDNTFLYGQEIFTNFKNMKGFVIENGKFYPEMEVLVQSKTRDTVLYNKNLLNGQEHYASTPSLSSNVILATPINSEEEYTIKYKITDTKGDAVFYSELVLELIKDPKVKVNENGLQLNEAYIFNQDTRTVITDGTIHFEENVLLDIQGLEGYKFKNGEPNIGISVNVTDADGKTILKKEDMLSNRILTEEEIKIGLGSTLKIKKGNLKNPIRWTVEIWDKNSDAKLNIYAQLKVD